MTLIYKTQTAVASRRFRKMDIELVLKWELEMAIVHLHPQTSEAAYVTHDKHLNHLYHMAHV